MKLVVLKGGDEAVPLTQCARAVPASTRTPGAVALSGDGMHWVLVNVSRRSCRRTPGCCGTPACRTQPCGLSC
jgi:hypothetical protein